MYLVSMIPTFFSLETFVVWLCDRFFVVVVFYLSSYSASLTFLMFCTWTSFYDIHSFWEISSIPLVSYILDFRFHVYIDGSQLCIFLCEWETWIQLSVEIFHLDIPQVSHHSGGKTPFPWAPPLLFPLLKEKKPTSLNFYISCLKWVA